MSTLAKITGLVQLFPPNPTGTAGLSGSMALDGCRTYAKESSGSGMVTAPSTPFPIGVGIAAIKLAAVRSLDGASFVAVVTSAAGTSQQVPFSDTFFASTPSSPITALALLGTGHVEYVLAGD